MMLALLCPAVTTALLVLAVGWARRRWIIVTVRGESMLPTLVPGQRIRVRRSPPAVVSAGDLVLAEMPTEHVVAMSSAQPSPGPILKRAVAVPGDRVPPASIPAFVDGNPVLVPPDMYVLLGDNPAGSFDSRQFGYVPAARILGVVSNRIPASMTT